MIRIGSAPFEVIGVLSERGQSSVGNDQDDTVVVPASIPKEGTDPFYVVTNGAEGQLGIAGVAPGDGPYHGGAWEVFAVTFNDGVTPWMLTSDDAVFAAQHAGDVTVSRNASADFRCPVTG